MTFAVDLREDLVKMLLPVRVSTHPTDTLLADLGGKQRAKSVPPEPHRFMADIAPALMQQIFHIPERPREPDVQHHSQADDVGTRLEIAERIEFYYSWTLRDQPTLLNRISSGKPHRYYV